MQERSMEVELNDELDKACKVALGQFCSDIAIDKGIVKLLMSFIF